MTADSLILNPERLLRGYFHAKDENRPHLMKQVFDDDALLEMNVKTDTIAFPAVSRGLEAITDTLVRKFTQTYENVYSFYLDRPPADVTTFSCDWLVGMSEKATGLVRVGCGRYDWSFQRDAPHRVEQLVITIEAMQSLGKNKLAPVMTWLTSLPYPWCTRSDVLTGTPSIDEIEPIVRYLTSGSGERSPEYK